MRRASASWETSPTTATHSAPCASSSARSRSRPSPSTSVATIRAPSCAKTTAVARPMPFAAPVMTAVLPPSRPTSSPPIALLLGVLDRPGLADDGDLDLARVGQLLLDLLDDVTGEPAGRQVVDLLGPDEDADLATRLDREGPIDPAEALGDRLQVLEPLHVRIHRLAAGARSRRADRVRDLDDRRLQAGVLDFLVVRGDRVDHLGREVVPLGDLGADRGMRSLDLVVDGLADVVEEAAHLGDGHVRTD